MTKSPMLQPLLNTDQIRALFTKPYGAPSPTAEQWKAFYADDVHFTDPTQQRQGIDAYILAQEGLLQRCDDIFLETETVVVSGETAFVEWRMGLKIKGIEFIYQGATRLSFNPDGKIGSHRDYFDFVGPTFAPVPVIGGLVRWLYKRFVA
tara:strand:- start:268 stop:717 length:450 start_codon:yes stop_codon:yes gene_type:complete